MSGERKKRWQKAKSPQPISLQDRDRDIVVSVHEFGFLTREQIQRLFGFACTTRVNVRLRKLFDHGYLSRRFQPTTRGSSKAIYVVGENGVKLAAERSGIDPLDIRRRQKTCLERKELFFDHDLSVNDVRIAFCQAMDKQRGLQLERWVGSTDCLLEYAVHDAKSNQEIRKLFRPDGYFRYLRDGKLFGCFLELDRSTMSTVRFQSKIITYLDYARSGFYRQRYGLTFFRVLVVTKSRERLLNLKSVTETLTDTIFWFTTIDRLTLDHIFDRIWERPGRDGLFNVME